MCYNCGCELPEDPMGKGNVHEGGGSLTEKSFEHMAKAWGMSVAQVKKNTYEQLGRDLKLNKK